MATILSAVLAAGAIVSWLDEARKLRWVALFALAALALAWALRRREARGHPPLLVYAAAGSFLALALVSASWSAAPRTSAGRALAFSTLLVACGALAYAAAGRPEAIRRVLDAVLAATGIVAVGGLLVLAFAHDRAVAPGSTLEPARYQGLGGGPDTAVMVMAVGLPLAAHALREARALPGRVLAAALLALLVGSIVAAQSRGSLLAGFGGLLAYAVLGVSGPWRKAVAAAAVLALFAVCLALTRLPEPLERPPTVSTTAQPSAPSAARAGYLDANLYLRLQDDVGHAPYGTASAPVHRTIFGTSGRAEAWQGAVDLGEERPALGFGFGTEGLVFVDRWVNFDSNLPENAYLGLFLQLGLVGVGLFLALVGLLAAAAIRGARRLRGPDARLVAACGAGLVVGLLLALTQSYIVSPGSNATAAVWICASLLAAAPAGRGTRPTRD